jgi:MtfA peptidase
MLAIIAFFVFVFILLLAQIYFREHIIIVLRRHFHRHSPARLHHFPEYHKIIFRYIPYYRKLSFRGKKKFTQRVDEFIKTKTFVGMENLHLTEEMKVLISASAIQLTFGLEKYLLEFFTTIRVYPQYFYSKLLKAELKGGASETGVIMLSWKDFLDGYLHPHDNYNLGLHEMAHVIKINVIKGADFDDKFSFYLDEWIQIGNVEFERLSHKNKSIIREYGGTNMHEFFAVCVEHFFENPEEFHEKLPDVYNHLCFLLNQDPMNPSEDYQLKRGFIKEINRDKKLIPIPEKIKTHYKYHSWHWAYSVMLFGIFGGAVFIGILNSLTIIPIIDLFIIGLAAIGLATIIQYRYLIHNRIFSIGDFILYLLFGIAPSVCSLFLIFNFLIRTDYFTEYHHIKKVHVSTTSTVFKLEDGAYSKYSWIRSMRTKKYDFTEDRPQILAMKFANGIFGYPIHVRNSVLTLDHQKSD